MYFYQQDTAMEQRLYPAARIAEYAGVTRQYINRYCKQHCPEAKVGTKIDISNPVMADFLAGKGVNLSEKLIPAEKRTSHLATTPVSQSESAAAKSQRKSPQKITATKNKTAEEIDISDHGNLTLNELCAYFGSDESYRGWLAAKKTQVGIVEGELKVKERLGQLVDRDLVEKAKFSLVDGFTSRLLTDFCKSSPIDLRAAFESGKDNIEIECLIRKLLSAQLNPLIKQLSDNARD